jgi:hypothetical protein
MSQRIDRSWVVFASIENDAHDRCVDVFYRPDRTFGFEEFRRDVEDAGAWTPVQYFSGMAYVTPGDAYEAAERLVPWFAAVLKAAPSLKRLPARPTE